MMEDQNLGVVAVKFNDLGNRIAVSTMDSNIKIFNLSGETGLSLHQQIVPETFKSWKVDFDPLSGELLTGTLALSTYNIDTGEKTSEFHTDTKFINALTYSPNGELIACGNIDGVMSVFKSKNKDFLQKWKITDQ